MSALAEQNLEQSLSEQILGYLRDPLGFVKYAYPWGTDALPAPPVAPGTPPMASGPRPWQRDVLHCIGAHLSNPKTRYQPLPLAVSSGHGIGKSALSAQVIHWAMSTCDDCKVVVTANTAVQLKTKTHSEASKWFHLAINAHWFDVQATSISVRDPKHERLWRTDFVTWNIHRTEAFAGLHNKGKRIVLIFDEASAIDNRIWEVAEGALTDEDTEIIWLAFGNPTQGSGKFRDCFGALKHRWKTFQVDARTVEGTNKEQIQRWIDDYGEDSDFVRVRVRGEFPRAASNQFIPQDAIAFCRKYTAEGFDSFPKILGVDVARFGDDQTVIFARQGRKSSCLLKTRGLSTAQVTDRVVEFIENEHVDAVVVDSDGIGAPVHDQLVARGYSRRLHEFHGGHPANDFNSYFNRRAEVWGLMRDALKANMDIPDDPELEADLVGPQYGFSNQQQVQLEKKDDMKKRGLSSPDMGDALAMTFAVRLPDKRQVKPPQVEYRYPGQENQRWMG